jgi:glucose-6-phosphate isomerase
LRARPFSFDISLKSDWGAQFDRRLERRLSELAGLYMDSESQTRFALERDPLVYEVFEMVRPAQAGELLSGLSVVHPGKVGPEYFMTKGHYHEVRETAEMYYCLQGTGYLLTENEQGDWAVEEFRPGRVVYVTPGWAHRSINIDATEDLITYFTYPGHAGHDYATIETRGFLKRVVEHDGRPIVIDDPLHSPNALAACTKSAGRL